MSPTVLAAAYVVIGIGCAFPELLRVPKQATAARRFACVLSALVTLALWPLWAPFALAPRPIKKRAERR